MPHFILTVVKFNTKQNNIEIHKIILQHSPHIQNDNSVLLNTQCHTMSTSRINVKPKKLCEVSDKLYV